MPPSRRTRTTRAARFTPSVSPATTTDSKMALRLFNTYLVPTRRPERRPQSEPSWELQGRMRDMENQMDGMYRALSELFPIAADIPQEMEPLHFENPYVTDKDGNRKMQLKLDVRQFKPEEIKVKTENGQLCVHARHEEKGEGAHVMREYRRQFALPQELELERLSSVLTPEGVLTIEAPLPAIEAPKPKTDVKIPIAHN